MQATAPAAPYSFALQKGNVFFVVILKMNWSVYGEDVSEKRERRRRNAEDKKLCQRETLWQSFF